MVLWFARFMFATRGWIHFGFVLHLDFFFLGNNGGLRVMVMGL